jgi:hypothetical protein
MRLVERYTRLDRDNMQFSITLTDPEIYRQPWVSETKNLRLVPQRVLMEMFCVPSEEQAFNRRIRDPAGGVVRPQ